jgi:asparagine synthase (glutamine-hydrolysing)
MEFPSRGASSDDVYADVARAAIETWGLQTAVRRFAGAFALAVWDRRHCALHLVRDRFGMKSLYYGWSRNTLLFGSELKALVAHPDFSGEIDRNAVVLLLRHYCIPAPYCIYRGIRKLPAGVILTLPAADARDTTPVAYWSARDIAERGTANRFADTDAAAVNELDSLLREAVAARMTATCPVGAFLSGGIDSSTVVALMHAQSDRRVKTFTIGLPDAAIDESQYARAIALHLGTDHTELRVTSDHAIAVIPQLPTFYDEPFADSSQIPTFLVCALARQQVNVALSGDGGDELFAGYRRHRWARQLWRALRWVPRRLQPTPTNVNGGVPVGMWDLLFRRASRVLPPTLRHGTPGYKLHKLAEVLSAPTMESMYAHVTALWEAPTLVVRDAFEPRTALTDPAHYAQLTDFTEKMLYLDLVTYLPDDILVKVDRASRAAGLDVRMPLLDDSVVEFAWRLPLAMKSRDGQSKWLLRQVLHRYVPAALVDRRKAGFGIPIHKWLRGPLRDWAEELLARHRLAGEGFFDPKPIRQRWAEHLSGKRRWEHHLWAVLMFQAWLEQRRAEPTPHAVRAADPAVPVPYARA